MIKGINRQIIEIGETSNVYYERAWLLVRPEYAGLQQNALEKEAKSLLKDIDAPSSMKLKRNLGFWAIRLGAAAVLGAATALIVQSIIL